MIEVGEYVRTKKQGIRRIDTIFKNKTVNKYGYEIGSEWDGKLYSTIKTSDIVKHSKNIIEPGDLVRIFVEENVDENGTTEDTCVYEVTATQVKDFYGNKLEEIGIVGEDGIELIPFANVRGIVTREQFASIEYKVED